MPRKTLVTGATGLLGSEIVTQLLSRGEDVRILRRADSRLDLLSESSDRVEHAVGEITDRWAVEEAVRGVTHVCHAAGRIGYGGKSEQDLLMRTNVQGTAVVVDAALHAGVRRLVHTSSVAALGRPVTPQGDITEDTEWQESPVNTIYGRSKYLAELQVFRGIAEGLDAVLVSPSMIFGIGRPGENTRDLVDKVRFRRLPGIPVGGNMVVDVKDAADGHIRAMDGGRTGERYILGSENLSWKEIIHTIAEAFGVDPPRFLINPTLALILATIIEGAGRIGSFRPLVTRSNIRQSARTYRYRNTKARKELGCTFRPFRQTVERIADGLSRIGE